MDPVTLAIVGALVLVLLAVCARAAWRGWTEGHNENES